MARWGGGRKDEINVDNFCAEYSLAINSQMGICTLSLFVVSSCRSSLALCGDNNLLGHHERNNQRTTLCWLSVYKMNASKPVIIIKNCYYPSTIWNEYYNAKPHLMWLAVSHLLPWSLSLPSWNSTDICITNFPQLCKVFCTIFSTTHVFYSINNRYN